jgi:hypothetical protein
MKAPTRQDDYTAHQCRAGVPEADSGGRVTPDDEIRAAGGLALPDGVVFTNSSGQIVGNTEVAF